MSIELATDLVHELSSAGILSAERATVVERAVHRHPDLTASELGTQLVKSNLATRFQIDEVLSGRTARLVRGKYILRDRIRAGPMGVVYRALHPDLGIDVVLKEVPAAMLATPQAIERFRREVRTLAKFQNARIIRVYDASLESSPPFLVMEYVAGVNLQELIEKQGPLPLPQALRLTIAAAEALQVVHDQGVIHRDVKPSNLMVSKEGELKLIDFGLARLQAHSQVQTPGSDLSGMFLVGTPDYMSPEQCGTNPKVDHRADIYSLGCTLLYLVSGSPPMPEGNLADKIIWHQSGAIPALANWVPHAPAGLDEVFQKMLARDPAQRWAGCAPLIQALEQIVKQLGVEPDETIPVGRLIEEEESARSAAETQATAGVTPLARDLNFSLEPSRPSTPARRSSRPTVSSSYVVGGSLGAAALVVLICLLAWSAASPVTAKKPSASKNKPVAGKVKKNPARRTIATLSDDESTFRFEIGPHNLVPGDDLIARGSQTIKPRGQLPEHLMPSGVQWNPVVTAHVDPIFEKQSRGGAGRLVYSEIDTAIEQDCDGEWLVGNTLTKDGSYWHLVLTDGVVTSSRLSPQDALEADLPGNAIQHTIDAHWKMRMQPVINIEDADLSISVSPAGLQKTTVSLLVKPRNDVVFDTAQLSFEYETTRAGEAVRSITEFNDLEWMSPPSGWQRVEFEVPSDRAIKTGSTIVLSVTAFAYQPRPGFYHICKPYEFKWNPPAGTLPKGDTPNPDGP